MTIEVRIDNIDQRADTGRRVRVQQTSVGNHAAEHPPIDLEPGNGTTIWVHNENSFTVSEVDL